VGSWGARSRAPSARSGEAAARARREATAALALALPQVAAGGGWVATTCVGLREWEDFRPRGFARIRLPLIAQILASMVAGMLITIPALAFFMAVQRHLVAGWGTGGLKG